MVRFLLLGSVEAISDAGPISIGRPRLRAVLAYLLLHANHVITTDLLVQAIWGGAGPTSARTQIQTDISIIRRILQDAGCCPIDTRPRGYLIKVDPEQLDTLEFGHRVRESANSPDPASAIAGLRAGLKLWRGQPLTGVTAAYGAQAREGLQEQRLQAYASLMDLELGLGHHADVIPELTTLVDSHPLNERLTGQLILALYRDGRQAEALGVARSLRAILADQHGLEPCLAIRDMEHAILQQDATLDVPATPAHAATIAPALTVAALVPPPPAQLPPDIAHFTGRAIHLRQLDRLVSSGAQTLSPVILMGPAGVGKTALAVHWGHAVAQRFPDGQLYVDTRGYSSDRPLTPLESLSRLLRALGAPADRIPTDVDEASAMYRTMLAGRRVLVILDNVHHVDWVRPLLPAAPGCLCLVTSRSQLGGLVAVDAAHPVTLDVLTVAEALSLLEKIIGNDRTDAEPESAESLAHACGLLPLALRIAAARLVLDPVGRIDDLVARLRPGIRLDTLRIPDDPQASLIAAFDHSYRVLGAEPRRAFRLIGLAPDVDFTTDTVAALAGVADTAARAMLDELTAAHLIERLGSRYVLHDLVREYAAARAMAEDDQSTRTEAVGRLISFWLRNVDAAASLVSTPPVRLTLPAEFAGPTLPFDTHILPLEWLDAERVNLVATIHHAASQHPQAAWLLADFLRGYFRRGMHLAEWIGAAEAAIQAADAAPAKSGLRAAAISELSLALAYQAMGHSGDAVAHFTAALGRARRAGWAEVEASAIGNLGVMAWRAGDLTSAARRLRSAVGIARRIGCPGIEANNLGNLGVVHQSLGQLTAAVEAFQELIPLFQQIGSREGEAHANSNLSDACMHLGQPADAIAYGTRAAQLFRDIGDAAEAVALIHIAASYCLQERYGDAAEQAGMALAITRRAEHRYLEVDCLDVLARVQRGLGDPVTALDLAQQAVRLAVDLDAMEKRTASQVGLAETYLALGRIDDAVREATEAWNLARTNGLRVDEAHALTVLAEVQLAAGDPGSAAGLVRDALRMCRRMGELTLVGRALRVRGAINSASAAARAARREAALIFEAIAATATK